MASSLAHAAGPNAAPLVLQPRLNLSTHPKKEISTYVQVDGQREKRKEEFKLCNCEDPELILTTVDEFYDACEENRLNLTTAVLRFTKFRQCTSDHLRQVWDVTAEDFNPDGELEEFDGCIDAFIARYVKDSALGDETHYLSKIRKPNSMSVERLSGRLQVINNLMSRFPGAGGASPFDDNRLKYLFNQMMPTKWQYALAGSHNRLPDDDFSYLDLTAFMKDQETMEQSLRAHRDRLRLPGGRYANPRYRPQRPQRCTVIVATTP